ncbi:MAG: hypothetical protein ABW250_09050 [Pyrinomonadaceae bacterium]
MSRKVLIVTREAAGVIYGRVVKATEQMLMQDFAHSHIERVVRDKLMRNAAQAEVAGFNYTLPGGMGVSVGEGHAIDVTGRSFDTLPSGAASVVTMTNAHGSLPRIDLIYATLVADSDREETALPFRQQLTQSELAAGANPYPITNSNVPTRRDNIATIGVRQGVAASVPAAPAAGVNEVALYQVRVNAGVTVITADKVTDVRRQMKSLNDALVRLDALEASPAILDLGEAIDDRVNTLTVDSVYLTKTYNDPGNLLTLDVDVAALGAALDSRFVNVTGDTMSGSLKVNIGGGTDPYPANNAAVRGVLNGAAGSSPIGLYGYGQAGLGNGDVAYGAFLHANADRGGVASGTTSYGLYAETGGGGTRYAGYFNGNLHVASTLTKSNGTFLIDHPVEPDAKDLIHSFVESNGFGLIYVFQVPLASGVATLDLDDALGITTAGTARRLLQNLVVVNVRHPAGTHVSDSITTTGSAYELLLTSDDAGDSATVVVFLWAVRADDAVKLSPFADPSGLLLLERTKPELTAGDLVTLKPAVVAVPADHPSVGRSVMSVQPQIIGKAGYRWQPGVLPNEPVVPVRSTSYVPEGLTPGTPAVPALTANDDSVGVTPWQDPIGFTSVPVPGVDVEGGGTPICPILTSPPTPREDESNRLLASDFGLEVPEGQTLAALVVIIKRQLKEGYEGAEIVDSAVNLIKGGVVQTAVNKADTDHPWQPAWVYASYVFEGDDLAGFTAADFEAADFGVAFSVTLRMGETEEVPNTTAQVDYISVTPYFE